MNEFKTNFTKLSLFNKSILGAILIICFYFIFVTLSTSYNNYLISQDIANLKFDVKRTYFQIRTGVRTVFDKYMVIELESPVSKEEFNNLSFEIPNEKVKAELLEGNKEIKITFETPFIKAKENYLQVKFYYKNVYRFNFVHSEVDEEYFKNRVPDKSPLKR